VTASAAVVPPSAPAKAVCFVIARARGRERNQTTDQSARGGRGKNQHAGGGSEKQMGLVSGGAEGVLYIDVAGRPVCSVGRNHSLLSEGTAVA
jgi:hypothetical protein